MPRPPKSLIAGKIAAMRDSRAKVLWLGPERDGVTQSMLSKWLVCRERFRVTHVLGLQPNSGWDKRSGYGDMWHVCEEALAKFDDSGDRYSVVDKPWVGPLEEHVTAQMKEWPHDREEIAKWSDICLMQFPEYVQHWAMHPDCVGRTPLMQERVFDVPYKLPSGRVVRLRGKFDSVDLVDPDGRYPLGVWLQENKTKGDVEEDYLRRMLKFDLQSMLYLVALRDLQSSPTDPKRQWIDVPAEFWDSPVLGVRYNVIRRPLSGSRGRGNIVQKKGSKNVPPETRAHFLSRLREDYIAKEPEQWFFRWKVPISAGDVERFRWEFLTPALEQLCLWYDEVGSSEYDSRHSMMNYRMPFGVYSPLLDGEETDVDRYLADGSEVGLRRVDKLFKELGT